MTSGTETRQGMPAPAPLRSAPPLAHASTIAAGLAVILSAFHFWPLEGHRLGEMLCPANTVVMLWIPVAGSLWFTHRNRVRGGARLVPASILAYVGTLVLSTAFAPSTARSVGYVSKLVLWCLGGYALFACACTNDRGRRLVHILACLALAAAIGACLIGKYYGHVNSYGFFGSPFKYGTYIGMLAPLCGIWLVMGASPIGKVAGMLLPFVAVLSSGTLGAVAAITAGLVAAAVLAPSWRLRGQLLMVAAAGLIVASTWQVSLTSAFRVDCAIYETDGSNIRQRYIEWQALINLLEDRALIGTGAGCVNEHRSEYYYRLPKLNTLAPFEENGYLATAAEGGILALTCLLWVIADHFAGLRSGIASARRRNSPEGLRTSLASFAGLTGACVANVFSAVQFNGVLVVFVLILVLSQAPHAREDITND